MFLHRYALMIGWPVPLLKQVMSSRDITEAMAYQTIDPHDQTRADFRAGIIASTIANVNRGKGSKQYNAYDFMPQYGKKRDNISSKLREFFGGKS